MTAPLESNGIHHKACVVTLQLMTRKEQPGAAMRNANDPSFVVQRSLSLLGGAMDTGRTVAPNIDIWTHRPNVRQVGNELPPHIGVVRIWTHRRMTMRKHNRRHTSPHLTSPHRGPYRSCNCTSRQRGRGPQSGPEQSPPNAGVNPAAA